METNDNKGKCPVTGATSKPLTGAGGTMRNAGRIIKRKRCAEWSLEYISVCLRFAITKPRSHENFIFV